MLEDFDDSVLGDPITYVWCKQFPGSESPLSLPVYAWPSISAFLMDSAVIRTVLALGISALPAAGTSTADSPIASGEGRLLACNCIILGFWNWWELRSRPDFSTVHQRSGMISWAKNRRWQRLSTYNGTQVLCCQIYRYCHSLQWQ